MARREIPPIKLYFPPKDINQMCACLGTVNVLKEKPRPNDFKGATVSIEKTRNILGWTPKVPFAQGLKSYVEFVAKDAKLHACNGATY